jgi:threonine/homoserine/homoserine lactone efflux protein
VHLFKLFFATYFASFGASVLPGLLNMNAAKISAEKGTKNAVSFSLGVCIIIGTQALLAVYISKFLFKNPHIIDVLMQIALVIFAFFAIYFFVHAKRGKVKEKKIKYVEVSRRNSFFKGMLMGVLNLLTLPFYCALNAAWKVSGWIKFEWQDTLIFIMSAAMGTFSILYVYIFYFNKLEAKSSRFSKYSDYILAALMLVLMFITLVRIYYR